MFTETLFNLKITGRILAKGKTFTLINLTGLVLGLTAAFILLSFAINELSYNKGFKNSNRIYRVIVRDLKGTKSGFVPLLMQDLFDSSFSQINKSSRIVNNDHFSENLKVKTGSTFIPINNFYYVDPAFIDIFSLSITSESGGRMLQRQNTILISEKFRKRIFGKENPVGKSINFRMDGDN